MLVVVFHSLLSPLARDLTAQEYDVGGGFPLTPLSLGQGLNSARVRCWWWFSTHSPLPGQGLNSARVRCWWWFSTHALSQRERGNLRYESSDDLINPCARFHRPFAFVILLWFGVALERKRGHQIRRLLWQSR